MENETSRWELFGLNGHPVDLLQFAQSQLKIITSWSENPTFSIWTQELFWLAYAVRSVYGRVVGTRSSLCACFGSTLNPALTSSQIFSQHPDCDLIRSLKHEASSFFTDSMNGDADTIEMTTKLQQSLARLDECGAKGEEFRWRTLILDGFLDARERLSSDQCLSTNETEETNHSEDVTSMYGLNAQPTREMFTFALKFSAWVDTTFPTQINKHDIPSSSSSVSPPMSPSLTFLSNLPRDTDSIPSLHSLIASSIFAKRSADDILRTLLSSLSSATTKLDTDSQAILGYISLLVHTNLLPSLSTSSPSTSASNSSSPLTSITTSTSSSSATTSYTPLPFEAALDSLLLPVLSYCLSTSAPSFSAASTKPTSSTSPSTSIPFSLSTFFLFIDTFVTKSAMLRGPIMRASQRWNKAFQQMEAQQQPQQQQQQHQQHAPPALHIIHHLRLLYKVSLSQFTTSATNSPTAPVIPTSDEMESISVSSTNTTSVSAFPSIFPPNIAVTPSNLSPLAIHTLIIPPSLSHLDILLRLGALGLHYSTHSTYPSLSTTPCSSSSINTSSSTPSSSSSPLASLSPTTHLLTSSPFLSWCSSLGPTLSIQIYGDQLLLPGSATSIVSSIATSLSFIQSSSSSVEISLPSSSSTLPFPSPVSASNSHPLYLPYSSISPGLQYLLAAAYRGSQGVSLRAGTTLAFNSDVITSKLHHITTSSTEQTVSPGTNTNTITSVADSAASSTPPTPPCIKTSITKEQLTSPLLNDLKSIEHEFISRLPSRLRLRTSLSFPCDALASTIDPSSDQSGTSLINTALRNDIDRIRKHVATAVFIFGAHVQADADCQYRTGMALAEGWAQLELDNCTAPEMKMSGVMTVCDQADPVVPANHTAVTNEPHKALSREERYRQAWPYFLISALQHQPYAQLEVGTSLEEQRGITLAPHESEINDVPTPSSVFPIPRLTAALYWYSRASSTTEDISDHALAQVERLLKL